MQNVIFDNKKKSKNDRENMQNYIQKLNIFKFISYEELFFFLHQFPNLYIFYYPFQYFYYFLLLVNFLKINRHLPY